MTFVESDEWRDLKASIDKDGYLKVSLRRDGMRYIRAIHRLVLETFIGPCPPGMETRHLDGNPANNRLDNLRWGTKAENEADKVRHGTMVCVAMGGPSMLREADIPEIFRLRESGMTHREIAARFGVVHTTIVRVLIGRTWANVSEPLGLCVGHGNGNRGGRNGRCRLTEADIPEVFRLRESGMLQRSIAARFGVGEATIRAVLCGKSWSHVARPPLSPHIGHRTFARGERNGRAKLREADLSEIFRLRDSGVTHREIALRFGVGRATIGRVLYGERWLHVARKAPGSLSGPLQASEGGIIHLGSGSLTDEIAALWGRGAIGLGDDFWR